MRMIDTLHAAQAAAAHAAADHGETHAPPAGWYASAVPEG